MAYQHLVKCDQWQPGNFHCLRRPHQSRSVQWFRSAEHVVPSVGNQLVVVVVAAVVAGRQQQIVAVAAAAVVVGCHQPNGNRPLDPAAERDLVVVAAAAVAVATAYVPVAAAVVDAVSSFDIDCSAVVKHFAGRHSDSIDAAASTATFAIVVATNRKQAERDDRHLLLGQRQAAADGRPLLLHSI